MCLLVRTCVFKNIHVTGRYTYNPASLTAHGTWQSTYVLCINVNPTVTVIIASLRVKLKFR